MLNKELVKITAWLLDQLPAHPVLINQAQEEFPNTDLNIIIAGLSEALSMHYACLVVSMYTSIKEAESNAPADQAHELAKLFQAIVCVHHNINLKQLPPLMHLHDFVEAQMKELGVVSASSIEASSVEEAVEKVEAALQEKLGQSKKFKCKKPVSKNRLNNPDSSEDSDPSPSGYNP